MWGGRFEGAADALFRAINDSLPVDWRLVQQDIRGSIAWACVLTEQEALSLVQELEHLSVEAAATREPPLASGAEDVHSWVEMRLIERLGDVGRKLHTGRSRNDQVATDLRLWTMEALELRISEIRAVQAALLDLGERSVEVILPGYTHLQRAQPISFAHWCLAYVEMLERDVDRCSDAIRRTSVCPLGCGALAGTTFPVDRSLLARELGFAQVARNSLDAVSDRGFVADALAAAAMSSVHLSRLAEDLILYTSQEFAFVEPDDGVSSGSSLMPQKKNPDSLELLRGKCGPIAARHAAMLMTLKGLPLAYNKDLQEDKTLLFGAMDEWSLCLRVADRVMSGLCVKSDRCRAAARLGGSLATELADWLVSRGMPFRTAHDAVGRVVRRCIEVGVEIDELPLADMQAICPQIQADAASWLTLESSLGRRSSPGGTSVQRVREALAAAREFVKPNIKGQSPRTVGHRSK
jgi:argininosuccinate lyase